MVSITFIQPDGRRQTIEAVAGESLMSQAKAMGVDGIEAECGGSMVCGTCHVHLADAVYQAIGPVPLMEADMLEYVIDPSATSRLSCQVKVDPAMEGMEVRLPNSQR
jgi:2Fe-2S ferredoxin